MTTRTKTPEDLSFLGLANRAGAVERGTEAARQALRRGEACLVLVARDSSEQQKQKVIKLSRAQGVPNVEIADRAALGAAVGRGPLTAVAVTDASFASELERRYANK